MYVSQWILLAAGVVVLGLTLALAHIVDQRRRLECLRWCYLDLSDWTFNRVRDARDQCVELGGEENIPYALVEVVEECEAMTEHHLQVMKRARVTPPSEADGMYILKAAMRE